MSPHQHRTALYKALIRAQRDIMAAQAHADALGHYTLDEDMGDLALWLHDVALQVGLCQRPSKRMGDGTRGPTQTRLAV